ncbi:MORN repeat-containing protein [Leptospira idonii]|uniref:Membrane-binding protein n=1 Tax=Leptospira idonii TaxID=1193500 RepID=A0A4V3JYF2_9LEPT|nr:membrane-binding protein [Leptospira idonii]TGN19796.1 membrane-binding protein [Leptospira idonii]
MFLQNLKKYRKTIIILFTVIILLASAVIFYVSRVSPKCINGNCKIGFGTLELRDGSYYVGSFYNSKFHDFGTFIASNGDKYEGYWHRGEKNGYGKYSYSDGSIYEGSFKRNKKSGKGRFTWPDSTVLEGSFIEGEPNGDTIVTLPSKVVLKGFYKDGIVINGQGIYIYDNGTRYIGDWKDGKRHGYGTLFSSEGAALKTGKWENDLFTTNLAK